MISSLSALFFPQRRCLRHPPRSRLHCPNTAGPTARCKARSA